LTSFTFGGPADLATSFEDLHQPRSKQKAKTSTDSRHGLFHPLIHAATWQGAFALVGTSEQRFF
jgi:hypothetical protein